ncbi:MAG: type II toxin-antitoxin system Phd/YefM family antitoxin [Candidatus Acidiferrales bacterium]
MKQMAAGKFKEYCLSIMDDVQATGEPVTIAKRGRPVAKECRLRPREVIFLVSWPMSSRLSGILSLR